MTLKELPEDFIVLERLAEGLLAAIGAASSGPFAVYELKKSGIDTPQAVARLAKASQTKLSAWRWAGLKDKHAQTTQAVSVAWPQKGPPPPKTIEAPPVAARLLGFAEAHVSAAQIEGNRFRIRVGGLTLAQAEAMRRRAKPLRDPAEASSLLFPNYFGDQRFAGVIHPSAFAARELLRGDPEAALKLLIATPRRKEAAWSKAAKRSIAEGWGDWTAILAQLQSADHRRIVQAMQRAPEAPFVAGLAALGHIEARMLLESYQSWLWNRLAAEWARKLQQDAFCAKDRFGALFFPTAEALLPQEALMLDLPAPMARYEGPFDPLARELYEAEALTPEKLALPELPGWRFGEAKRALVVRARDVVLEAPLPDARHPGRHQQTVSFELPRGAYATSLLRALGE